jgi:NDP-sugar pyrophosphorylase family protein
MLTITGGMRLPAMLQNQPNQTVGYPMPATDQVVFGKRNDKAAKNMSIQLLTNRHASITASDVQLLWTDEEKGEFQFVKRGKPGDVLAEGRVKPQSGVTVQAYDGKGGFSIIINTPHNKYILMPGSTYAEGDNYIKTSGKPPSAAPLPALNIPDKTGVQAHTNVGMILGAGLSSRIEPIPAVSHAAKPAFPITQDESIIGRSARLLKEHGMDNIIVNAFYKPETTEKALKQSSQNNQFHVHILDESKLGNEPSGTAGGLVRVLQDPKLRKLVEGKHMVLMAGDSVMNFDFSDLVNRHVKNNAAMTLAGYKVADADLDKFGIIVTDTGHSGEIKGFVEKPALHKDGLAKIGDSRLGNTFVHVIAPELYPLLESMINDPAYIERQKDPKTINPGLDFAMDIYPRIMEMVKNKSLKRNDQPLSFRAEEVKGYWNDVGNTAAYFHTLEAIYGGLLGEAPKNDHFYKEGIAYWDKTAYDNARKNGVSLKGNAIAVSHALDE